MTSAYLYHPPPPRNETRPVYQYPSVRIVHTPSGTFQAPIAATPIPTQIGLPSHYQQQFGEAVYIQPRYVHTPSPVIPALNEIPLAKDVQYHEDGHSASRIEGHPTVPTKKKVESRSCSPLSIRITYPGRDTVAGSKAVVQPNGNSMLHSPAAPRLAAAPSKEGDGKSRETILQRKAPVGAEVSIRNNAPAIPTHIKAYKLISACSSAANSDMKGTSEGDLEAAFALAELKGSRITKGQNAPIKSIRKITARRNSGRKKSGTRVSKGQNGNSRTWSPAEDKLLLDIVSKEGARNWTNVASYIPHRSGKQVRERYINQLNPNVKHGDWEPWEDDLIIRLNREIGNKWSVIAKHLKGRTDNAIKNRYNSSLKPKEARKRGKRNRTSTSSVKATK